MIRKLQGADLDKVAALWLDTNRKAHHFIPEQYWLDNYNTVKELLLLAEVYVYEKQNKIYGFIGMNGKFIEGLFVSSGVQSKGIGTQLLSHVKNVHSQLNLRVYEKNEQAIRFYQQHGFQANRKEVDENTGENEFLMTWSQADKEYPSA